MGNHRSQIERLSAHETNNPSLAEVSSPMTSKVTEDDDVQQRSLHNLRIRLGDEPPPVALQDIAARWKGIRSEDAVEEAAALMIAMKADKFDYRRATEVQAFSRFSWLNRMNLLFYQHQLRQMQTEYREDFTQLIKDREPERFRETLEAYSLFYCHFR